MPASFRSTAVDREMANAARRFLGTNPAASSQAELDALAALQRALDAFDAQEVQRLDNPGVELRAEQPAPNTTGWHFAVLRDTATPWFRLSDAEMEPVLVVSVVATRVALNVPGGDVLAVYVMGSGAVYAREDFHWFGPMNEMKESETPPHG
jgi:hypothetical protein